MSRRKLFMPTTLPFELIWETLTLLPALCVLGCKSVCRAWKTMIESPTFVKQHLREMIRHNKGGYMLDYESRRQIIVVHRSELTGWRDLEKPFEVVGSCNGILCAIGVEDNIFLWNLTTNRYRVLPPHNIPFHLNECNMAVLSFGVGYDGGTDDTKVIRLVRFTGSNLGPYLSIYSSRQNIWRDVGHCRDMDCAMDPGVYVKGALHWIISFGPHSRQVAALDMGSGEFRVIRTPVEALDPGFPHNIGALDSDTLIYYSSFYFFENRISFWILKEYGDDNSWTKITMDGPILRNAVGLVSIQPMRFKKPDDSKILMRVDPIGTFVYWDMVENRFYETDYDVVVRGHCTMNTYIESVEVP